MKLTEKQYRLLYDTFNASIKAAMKSGIPIGQEYYEDIETIKTELIKAIAQAIKEKEG